jgi:hypothetical protein
MTDEYEDEEVTRQVDKRLGQHARQQQMMEQVQYLNETQGVVEKELGLTADDEDYATIRNAALAGDRETVKKAIARHRGGKPETSGGGRQSPGDKKMIEAAKAFSEGKMSWSEYDKVRRERGW